MRGMLSEGRPDRLRGAESFGYQLQRIEFAMVWICAEESSIAIEIELHSRILPHEDEQEVDRVGDAVRDDGDGELAVATQIH